ncbi:E3 ubiquitin-protein ligase TRIM56-like [Saccoglossus kowalevskii]
MLPCLKTWLQNPNSFEKIGKEFLTCSVCLEYFKHAKTLPCLHSFCEGCLNNIVEKTGQLTCPECRTFIGVKSNCDIARLGTNCLLNGLIGVISTANHSASEFTCDGCEENNSTHRCVDCALNICRICVKMHAKIRSTKHHCVIAADEFKSANIEQAARYRHPRTCGIAGHEDCALKCYCETCSVPVCHECTIIEHRVPEHKHAYLKDVADNFSAELAESMEQLAVKEME